TDIWAKIDTQRLPLNLTFDAFLDSVVVNHVAVKLSGNFTALERKLEYKDVVPATASGKIDCGPLDPATASPEYAHLALSGPVFDVDITPALCNGLSPEPLISNGTVSTSSSSVAAGGSTMLRGTGFEADQPMEATLHSAPVKLAGFRTD